MMCCCFGHYEPFNPPIIMDGEVQEYEKRHPAMTRRDARALCGCERCTRNATGCPVAARILNAARQAYDRGHLKAEMEADNKRFAESLKRERGYD